MALTHHIAQADTPDPTTFGGSRFTDDSLVPATLAGCAIPSETVGLALRYLWRTAHDDRELHMELLAEILGE